MSETCVSAALLVIGNEILSGRTKDANLPYIGARLSELGIRLAEVRVIPDSEAAIVQAVNELRGSHAYVFTTGGIGPTHDDITAAAVAKAFGVKVILHPEAHRILDDHYGPEQLTEARLKMAHTPDGATLVENPVSGAPGFRIGNVIVMAGVPAIMQAMFESVAPTLAGGQPLLSLSIGVALPEGELAEPLGQVQAHHPKVEIGSYPYYGGDRLVTNLVLRSSDAAALAEAAAEVRHMARGLGAEPLEREG